MALPELLRAGVPCVVLGSVWQAVRIAHRVVCFRVRTKILVTNACLVRALGAEAGRISFTRFSKDLTSPCLLLGFMPCHGPGNLSSRAQLLLAASSCDRGVFLRIRVHTRFSQRYGGVSCENIPNVCRRCASICLHHASLQLHADAIMHINVVGVPLYGCFFPDIAFGNVTSPIRRKQKHNVFNNTTCKPAADR